MNYRYVRKPRIGRNLSSARKTSLTEYIKVKFYNPNRLYLEISIYICIHTHIQYYLVKQSP